MFISPDPLPFLKSIHGFRKNRLVLRCSINILEFDLHSSLGVTHYCSVAKSCPTLCNPMDCSIPGFLVLHYLLVFAQIHVHWVSDAIHPSHLLSSPSLPALNLPQHLDLFQWVGSSHQVAEVLELHFSISPSSEYWGFIRGNNALCEVSLSICEKNVKFVRFKKSKI